MSKEEAVKNLNEIIELTKEELESSSDVSAILGFEDLQALNIVMQELENSISKQAIEEIIKRNLRKDTIFEHKGYLYGFNECQQLTKEVVQLLEGK